MQIFHSIEEWLAVRQARPKERSLGFVPTMGNFHAGHRSLFSKSLSENEDTIVSIFINPNQFNNHDDYIHYPRTLNADLEHLKEQGVAYCFIPQEQAIYPDNYTYQLQENQFANRFEGVHRPGHFTGVLTVVMKFFNLIKPQRAYFGEKDYQQLKLIQNMVDAFFMDIGVIACPTIREPSGLACSSRNNRLNKAQRDLADTFARIFLQAAKSCQQLRMELEQHPISVDYLEDWDNRRLIAVNVGGIRLIDNYPLEEKLRY